MSTKEAVLSRIGSLPDSATLTDIREELEIVAAIEEGEKDIDEGRSYTPAEMRQSLQSWITR